MSLPDVPKTKHLIIELDEDITLNMAKLMRIDASNLTEEYERHAGWQALISAYHAEAQIRLMRKEDEFESKEAEMFFYLLNNFETLFNTKPSVERIKMALVANPELTAMRAEILALKAFEIQVATARNSFSTRREMLISLGAHERSERK